MKPAVVYSPGEYIAEFLQNRGQTELDLANALGWKLEKVHAVVAHDRFMEEGDLVQLAHHFETSAQLWRNLQAAHFEKLCEEASATELCETVQEGVVE